MQVMMKSFSFLIPELIKIFFFFNDTATPEISPLPLPAALPICLTEGNCSRDSPQFLDANALQGAHIAVPMHPYWIEFGLGAARTKLMNDAIAAMQSLGATVETFEIPSQNVLNNYGTCVTAADVATRRATPVGTVPPCSTVLLFGFKRDLNAYLASKEFGPGTSASSATIPGQTVKTLSDVISFNNLHPEVALKYGQAIAEAADMLDTGPGQDLDDYLADRALDLKLTRTCGLDVLYTGMRSEERRVGKECRSRWSPYH